MKALILETSTQKNFLILAEQGKLKKSKLLTGGPELSKTLAKEVKILLEKESSVDFLLVGQGPGSYTGIRVGAALAKGLSFGWRVPLYGFCSLKAFTPTSEGPFAIVLDARMGGAYVLRGENKGNRTTYSSASLLVKLDDLNALLHNIPCIVSPSPTDLKERAPSLPPIQEASLQLDQLSKDAFSPEMRDPLQLTYFMLPQSRLEDGNRISFS